MRALLLLAALCAGAAGPAPAPTPEELAPSAEQLRRSCERSLLGGLKRSQAVITLREYDVLGRLAKDKRIKAVFYLNRSAEVRWAQRPELWTITFDQLRKEAPPTDAVERALKANAAVVAAASKGLYEVAMPLISEGQLQGVLDVLADAKGLRSLGADAQKTLKRDAPMRTAARTTKPKDAAAQRQAQQHFLSGLIFFQKGDAAKAREEWLLAQKLDPGDPEAPAALKRVKTKQP
ncbi:MAG: hypothetical protein HY077_17805 [Elusimicrobia bacterium]|nr:hypothetical protein [Elusimicrobiota bacterium]